MIEKYRGPKTATFLVTFLLFIGIASIFLILTFTVGKKKELSGCGKDYPDDYYDYLVSF